MDRVHTLEALGPLGLLVFRRKGFLSLALAFFVLCILMVLVLLLISSSSSCVVASVSIVEIAVSWA